MDQFDLFFYRLLGKLPEIGGVPDEVYSALGYVVGYGCRFKFFILAFVLVTLIHRHLRLRVSSN